MSTAKRVSAQEAKALVNSGASLLVCIYDDEKFAIQAHLEGAMPYSEFLKMKPTLGRDTDIIFY